MTKLGGPTQSPSHCLHKFDVDPCSSSPLSHPTTRPVVTRVRDDFEQDNADNRIPNIPARPIPPTNANLPAIYDPAARRDTTHDDARGADGVLWAPALFCTDTSYATATATATCDAGSHSTCRDEGIGLLTLARAALPRALPQPHPHPRDDPDRDCPHREPPLFHSPAFHPRFPLPLPLPASRS